MGKILGRKMFEIYTITLEQEGENDFCVYLASYGGKQLIRQYNNYLEANKLFKDINEYNLFDYLKRSY